MHNTLLMSLVFLVRKGFQRARIIMSNLVLRRSSILMNFFGAYLRKVEENVDHPTLPFFTATSLFDHSEVWSSKQGVLLYTDGAT